MSLASGTIAWPAELLAQGCEALAHLAGLTPGLDARRAPPALPPVPPGTPPTRDWLERAGSALGIVIERVGFGPAQAPAVVRGAGPAVLPLGEGYVLLIAARAGRARVLGRDGALHALSARALAGAVATGADRARAAEPRPELAAAGLGERERRFVAAELARERTGTEELGCLLLRAAPGGSWRRTARAGRWAPRVMTVLGAKLAMQVLWVLSWVLIGRAALDGRLEGSWLVAWVLLLASLVPLEAFTLRAAGRLAVDLGAELRSRLMAGALRLSPETLRREGVGQALGRVLEAGALESALLTGGFAALFACVELATALFALAQGALPALQVPLLLAWTALAGVLGWRAFAARRAWTQERLALSHDLVEAMVGHATRLAQEAPERRHESEDRSLMAYLPTARRLDRAQVALTALVPRGWMLVGLLSLAPALLGDASAPRLAIALGGVLLAQRAFRQLVEGLSDLGTAAVAWLRVEPTLRALRAVVREGGGPESASPASASAPALSARQVSFRHEGRCEAVLEGCDLQLARGEKCLLEGPSGSGKSTLAAILAGLRRADAGLVLAGGLDRPTLGEAGWRRRVAAAPQFHENHVFGGTLLFNLLMGRSWPPTADDVRDAGRICARLGLAPLIERMPAGMLQLVGETGWRLSHGERARVWIARALLQGADAVVIDEGLDALDAATQRAVLGVLGEEPCAVLLIAHRSAARR